jgi:predicted alpha/beta hydrolase
VNYFAISTYSMLSQYDANPSDLEFRFPATDGYLLGGRLFATAGPQTAACAALFIGGGGVPTALYRRFARYIASRGIPVLTFDYRGVGASRPTSLRGFHATAQDWGEKDIGGAITELARRFPNTELVCVTHSIGTLLMGAAQNVAALRRFVFLSPSTGYLGDYRLGQRLGMFALWHGVMPLVTLMCGFFPGRRLGLGEDLPKAVALQWARSRRPEEWATSQRVTLSFNAARGRVLVIAPSDDGFATLPAVNRLLALYPNLSSTKSFLAPRDLAIDKIGHFGLFRRDRVADIWPTIAEFLVAE